MFFFFFSEELLGQSCPYLSPPPHPQTSIQRKGPHTSCLRLRKYNQPLPQACPHFYGGHCHSHCCPGDQELGESCPAFGAPATRLSRSSDLLGWAGQERVWAQTPVRESTNQDLDLVTVLALHRGGLCSQYAGHRSRILLASCFQKPHRLAF